MKRNIFQAALIFFPVAIITSCAVTYGDHTTSQMTRVSNIDCINKPEQVYLFFEGEPIDFAYDKVGFIEASGERYASNEEILYYLKYKAWTNCANGVIYVTSDYKNREEGLIFHQETNEVYSSTVFKGLAVQIDRNSAFISKYGNQVDTLFVDYVKADYKRKEEKTTSQIIFSIFGIIAGLMLLMASGS